jgi:hypothetical protein
MERELQKFLSLIPHDNLLLQLDICSEVQTITPSETVTSSGNSAAMVPSPDFDRRRDGIVTRSTRAKVADSRLQQLPLRVTRAV